MPSEITPIIRERIVEGGAQMELIVATIPVDEDYVKSGISNISHVLDSMFGVGVDPAATGAGTSITILGNKITVNDPVIAATNRHCFLVVGR